MALFTDVGIYGKLPSHGDFLRRRVSEEFVRVWDRWLQECLVASREALADQWLDRYLTGPVWRFACAGGAVGPAPVVGLVAPSVDRVGRYFPLTLVAELQAPEDPLVVAVAAAPFFDAAERLVIDTLAADRVDFERFDSQVSELSTEFASIKLPRRLDFDGTQALVAGSGHERWMLPLQEGAAALGPLFNGLLARHLAGLYDPMVIWWTEGSAYVDPGCVVGRGLPDPSGFASMLDGARTDPTWRTVTSAAGPSDATPSGDTLIGDLLAPRFRSAAASDVGRVRSVNQDAFIERSDVGVWVVADGLGGHRDGEVASRMVCDALADFVPDAGFDQMIDAARERLERVNDYLVRDMAASNGGPGSTVVALFARGSRFAVLWAGDSRLYRLRDGLLEQVTEDHSLAAVDAAAATGESVNAVTRAVGGEASLALDQRRDRVRRGDRFLLCSDGLTRTVPEAQIAQWMGQEDVRRAVDGLIQTTLENGAPDNVTALIVEAFA